MTEIRNSNAVWVIGFWILEFICNLVLGIWDYEMFDDFNNFYDFSFRSAFFNAAMCTSPAKCTGLLPCIGSQPEGSA